MQSVSSRIWTCVAVSISYDDNHYTTSTSLYCVLVLLCIDPWELHCLCFYGFVTIWLAQYAEVVEYADCITANG